MSLFTIVITRFLFQLIVAGLIGYFVAYHLPKVSAYVLGPIALVFALGCGVVGCQAVHEIQQPGGSGAAGFLAMGAIVASIFCALLAAILIIVARARINRARLLAEDPVDE